MVLSYITSSGCSSVSALPSCLMLPPCLALQFIPYFILGVSEVWTNVGTMELMYSQVSIGMRSLGSSINLLTSECKNTHSCWWPFCLANDFLRTITIVAEQAVAHACLPCCSCLTCLCTSAHIIYYRNQFMGVLPSCDCDVTSMSACLVGWCQNPSRH